MKPILVNHKPTIEGLVEFEREFSQKYGPFVFFGFLWPEFYADRDSNTNPYVAAAAPWSDPHLWSSEDNKAVRESFHRGIAQIMEIERWFWKPDSTLMNPAHQSLEPVLEALEIEHDLVELVNVELFGQEIRRAYIITSQRLSPAAVEGQD